MGTNGIGCTEWERDFDPVTEQPRPTEEVKVARAKIIDRPWAIVYGPKYTAKHGDGLMYGLGLTREEAWSNAILVMNGHSSDTYNYTLEKAALKAKGMITRQVEVRLCVK